MKECSKKCFTYTLFLTMLFLPIIPLNCFESFHFDKNISYNRISSKLNTNQVNNFSITSSLHKLVWIEGQLNLFLISNESGLINCEIKDSNNGKYFTQVNRIINLTGFNQIQVIRLIFHPHLTTLPGRYNLTLNITGFYNYTESFDLILGMGYVILILILMIFGIGLIIILMKKTGVKIIKPVSVSTEGSIHSEISEAPGSKIQCPECKRLIDEGLAFCPECGSRIPEFLRFNPNSPRVI